MLLLCTNSVYAKKKKKGPVEINVTTSDGFHIVGQLDIPKDAKVKDKAPLVIFLHSIGRDSTEWGDFPNTVKDKLGVATLTIDLRGHGKSIVNNNGKKFYWQYFTEKSYKKFPDDVLDVLKYVKKEYPEVDCYKISIVGASLGANTALMAGSYAIKYDSMNIKSIIMLSPMLKYKGFDLRLPIVRYGEKPLLFIVSQKDNYAYQSSTELIKFAQGKKLLKVYPSGGNGVYLIKFQKETAPLIMDWIKESLITEPPRKEIIKR